MVTRKIMNNSSVTRKINQKGKGIRKTIKKLSNKYKKYKHSKNSKKLLKDRKNLLKDTEIKQIFDSYSYQLSRGEFESLFKVKEDTKLEIKEDTKLEIKCFKKIEKKIKDNSIVIDIGLYLDIDKKFGIYAIKITYKNLNIPIFKKKEIFKLNKSFFFTNTLCSDTLNEIEKHLNNEPLVSKDKNVIYLFKKFINIFVNIFDLKELNYNKKNVISNKLKYYGNAHNSSASKLISKRVKKTQKKLAKHKVGNKYKNSIFEKIRKKATKKFRKYSTIKKNITGLDYKNFLKISQQIEQNENINIYIDYTSFMKIEENTDTNISKHFNILLNSFDTKHKKFIIADKGGKYHDNILQEYTTFKLNNNTNNNKSTSNNLLFITTLQNLDKFIEKLKDKIVPKNIDNINCILLDDTDSLSIELLIQMLQDKTEEKKYKYKVLSNNSSKNANKIIIGSKNKIKDSEIQQKIARLPYQINNIQTTVFGGISSSSNEVFGGISSSSNENNIKLPTVFLGPEFKKKKNDKDDKQKTYKELFIDIQIKNPDRSKVYFKLSDNMYKKLFEKKGYKDKYNTINLMHPRGDFFLTINHNTNISKTKIDNPNIKLIIFSDKIENIGEDAFNGKESLKFDFSKAVNLTTINKNAFKGCKNIIGELKLPDTLEYIGESAFEGCTGITELDLSNTKLVNINVNSFKDCSNIKTIILPDTLKYIGKSAFEGCTGITKLDLSNTKLVNIDVNTFKDCSNIKTIILPDTLEYIDNTAFKGCTNINTVIPNKSTVTSKKINDAIKPYLKNQNNFEIEMENN